MNETTPEDATIIPPLTQTRVSERKMGGTTYTITTSFKLDSKEGLLDKLVRLIENDLDRESRKQ